MWIVGLQPVVEILFFELFEDLFDAFGLGCIGDESCIGSVYDDQVAESEGGDEVIVCGAYDAAVGINAAEEAVDGIS